MDMMNHAVEDPRFRLRPTSAFSVICLGSGSHETASAAAATRACRGGGGRGKGGKQDGETSDRHGYGGEHIGVVCIDVVCPYTRELVVEGFGRRRDGWRVTTDSAEATLHWGDYEMIDWERVVSGELRASSYCVRKGMSRKAQLSRYCNKYALKRPETPLKAALPRTLVIDTWEAFDDNMTFNLGGDIAAFGSDLGVRQSVSLATRLDWCLSDAQEWVEQRNDEDYALASKSDAEVGTRDSEMTPDSTDKEDSLASRVKVDRKDSVSATAARCMREDSAGRRRRWILKPSTLNKGAALAFGEGFEPLRKAIHESPDIREWVLQEYVERPLLVQGRKFHLRAYVLAVGCIRVYLFEDVLLLRAAKRYPSTSATGVTNVKGFERDDRGVAFGDEDPLAHITNTARQAEDEAFVEEDNVLLLEDLVGELEKQGLTFEGARAKVDRIFSDLAVLTAELFRAFRGEFTVFSPLPGCFEHFGLDFMVDEDFHVWLLEANPGPDFKQTGSRLKSVVAGVIEATMQICLDQATGEHAGGIPKEDASSASLGTEGGSRGVPGVRRGFRAILDEQWRGIAAGPNMKML